MHRLRLALWAACLASPASGPLLAERPQTVATEKPIEQSAEKVEFFEKQIRPLLVEKCVECHSGMTPDGDLDLSSRDGFVSGGSAGELIDGTEFEFSLLYNRLVTTDEDAVMPPGEPLEPDGIKAVQTWIADGAVWPQQSASIADASAAPPEHWAFRPVQRPEVPDVNASAWCWNPVDRFVLRRMEDAGLQPVDDSDRSTWLRRIHLDLTGLPPTVERQFEFLEDASPNREQREVERLLSSRSYAERQARHWLDVARYADTSGDGTDTPIPEARYYRDWVIDAFDSDLPYDQFLIQQIAGDVLASQQPDDPEAFRKVIATGFIALSRRFGNSKFADMHQIIDDTIDTLGKSTMGLSLGCARCHHHKFDPVTMDDYYGLYGYFDSTQYPHAGTEHQKERSDLPAIDVPESQSGRYESSVAWAVSDKAKSSDAAIHLAGDPHRKGDEVPRGFLGFLSDQSADIPDGGSGRLALARWVASAEHPLTARVMVNRIWQSHFGKGLVDNANNFGVQSAPPTHPELLDYLASEFVRSGWSVKHIHRLIVSSHLYQLSSQASPSQTAKDQANRLLWHFPRVRMDAETLRDSILLVSGELERGDGGRHPFKPTDKLKYTQGRPFDEIYDHERRSVYLMTPRLNRHPMMALFDGADANTTTGARGESTVPLQSLFVLNGAFVGRHAEAFAARVLEQEKTPEDRVQLAWRLALGRSASANERDEVLDFIASMNAPQDALETWTSIARVLFGTNEFIYID